MAEEREAMPVSAPFGPQVISTGHLNAKGEYVEDALWTASQGNLPPGSRPRLRRPRSTSNREVTDDARGS
jgi:hypothetical protein